jgi:hypothetical protein
MSGARGGSQQFAIRLALDGADAVEGGLRRVQATAVQVGAEVQRAGDSTGRALAVIDRGTQAASQGLTKLGGDFAALSPIVDNAGGAIGRLVTALGSGAGLAGVLGAVGGAVTAAVAVYQNWDSVTRAVASATDILTGSVRAVRSELQSTYDLLNQIRGLAPQAASAAAQGRIGQIDERVGPIRDRIAQNEAALRQAQSGLGEEQRRNVISGAGAVPGGQARLPAEVQAAREAALRRIEERRSQRPEVQARVAEIEANLRADRAALGDLEAERRRQQGIISAAEENVGSVTRPPPAEEAPARARAGGGGGGRAAPRVDDPSRERDAFTARFDPAERYRQTLEGIVALNDRLAAAGQSPLPDEAVLRATEQAMADYQRATEGAAQSTASLADGSKDFERAATAGAKALAGAFEDLVFEGQNFDDVLKNLERSLLRVGNQYLLQPLFQQGLGALFGTPGGGAGGAGGGGIGGLLGSAVGSLFGASGGLKGVEGAAGLVSAAFPVMHDGGLVGAGGGASRLVPMGLFAGAPRLHSGGLIGPNEVPAILERGERVLSRREAAAYGRGGGMTININTPDAGSFRNSEGQIMSRLASAIARSGRNR